MKKNIIVLSFICLLIFVLSACNGNTLTVTDGSTSEYQITVGSSDNTTMASAEYLANAVRNKTGVDIPIVSETEAAQNAATPKTEIILGSTDRDVELTAESLGEKEYGIAIEDNKIIIAAENEDLFGAVKAITDKWVSEDLGINKDGDLIINDNILQSLTDLDITVTGTLKILSQNIRYTDDPDGNSIDERAPRFLQLLEEYQPDLIGTQEATKKWMDFFEEKLGDTYGIIGCSRNGHGETDGEWNAILYRKDRFELIEGETFWLSDTPYEDGTMLDYSGSIRICTWVLLEDKVTGKRFTFNNTHLQNSSEDEPIRTQQITILIDYLRDGVGYLDLYPAFLTGDFNADRKEPAYTVATETFRDSALSCMKNLSEVNYTYHAYGNAKQAIDYCFHSLYNSTVLDYKILDDQYGGYVSDHYGVLITAVIN